MYGIFGIIEFIDKLLAKPAWYATIFSVPLSKEQQEFLLQLKQNLLELQQDFTQEKLEKIILAIKGNTPLKAVHAELQKILDMYKRKKNIALKNPDSDELKILCEKNNGEKLYDFRQQNIFLAGSKPMLCVGYARYFLEQTLKKSPKDIKVEYSQNAYKYQQEQHRLFGDKVDDNFAENLIGDGLWLQDTTQDIAKRVVENLNTNSGLIIEISCLYKAGHAMAITKDGDNTIYLFDSEGGLFKFAPHKNKKCDKLLGGASNYFAMFLEEYFQLMGYANNNKDYYRLRALVEKPKKDLAIVHFAKQFYQVFISIFKALICFFKVCVKKAVYTPKKATVPGLEVSPSYLPQSGNGQRTADQATKSYVFSPENGQIAKNKPQML